VDYTSQKKKLLQSWRYKTLAVIKRHKNHLSLFLQWWKRTLTCICNRKEKFRSSGSFF